jgi:hypothetical protein
MDNDRFDRFVRWLEGGATRRGALGLLAGAAGLGLLDGSAKRRRRGKARGRSKADREAVAPERSEKANPATHFEDTACFSIPEFDFEACMHFWGHSHRVIIPSKLPLCPPDATDTAKCCPPREPGFPQTCDDVIDNYHVEYEFTGHFGEFPIDQTGKENRQQFTKDGEAFLEHVMQITTDASEVVPIRCHTTFTFVRGEYVSSNFNCHPPEED